MLFKPRYKPQKATKTEIVLLTAGYMILIVGCLQLLPFALMYGSYYVERGTGRQEVMEQSLNFFQLVINDTFTPQIIFGVAGIIGAIFWVRRMLYKEHVAEVELTDSKINFKRFTALKGVYDLVSIPVKEAQMTFQYNYHSISLFAFGKEQFTISKKNRYWKNKQKTFKRIIDKFATIKEQANLKI